MGVSRSQIITFILCLACVLLMSVYFSTETWTYTAGKIPKSVWNQELFRDEENTNHDVSAPEECIVDETMDPSQPGFYNIFLEQEALGYKPCVDEKLAASPIKSRLKIIGDQKLYKLGGIVRILITLYDSNGKRKTTGGDHLRATLHNLKDTAHAPGVVTDNNDGSYTAELKTFWTGVSVISVSIAYTRELITALYRVRTEVLATRNIIGKYSSRTYSEERLCHPNHRRLAEAFNQSELCNLTYINSGMPFYCLKPTNEHLLCQDLTHVKTDQPYPVLSYTNCEKNLLKRNQPVISQRVTVEVADSKNRQTCPVLSTTPCSKYNRKRLWTTRQPSGYFKDGKWNLALCKGIDRIEAMSCLNNKRLYLLGDSTQRHWYAYILDNFNCTPTTEKWKQEKWHREAECQNTAINFAAGWYPHSQPFFVGNHFDDVRYTLFSTSRRLDNIPSDENAIIVIQEFMHVLAYHHSVFEERMKLVKQSVERLLNRNKKAIVMLKAPHTFKTTPAYDRLNDYFGFVYINLLYNIFDGLHDRVVLLNNADATNAMHISSNHPPQNIVSAMVLQAFSFACQ